MRTSIVIAVAASFLLLACGGSSGGGGSSATLTATGALAISANQFTSVSAEKTCNVLGTQIGAAFVAIGASDQPGMCGYLQKNQEKQNVGTITILVAKLNPTGGAAAVTAGTYPIETSAGTGESQAFVQVSRNDATCQSTTNDATTGTVTVTSNANGRIQGSVDATLANGGKVSGNFDAPSCAVTLPIDICTGNTSLPTGACVP